MNDDNKKLFWSVMWSRDRGKFSIPESLGLGLGLGNPGLGLGLEKLISATSVLLVISSNFKELR